MLSPVNGVRAAGMGGGGGATLGEEERRGCVQREKEESDSIARGGCGSLLDEARKKSSKVYPGEVLIERQ